MMLLASGASFTITPPSGMFIIIKSIQSDILSVSGVGILASSSLGTINSTLYGVTPIVTDMPFEYLESITFTSSGTITWVNYIYAGEIEAYKYLEAAEAYSKNYISRQAWPEVVQSGSFQTGYGG